MFTQASALVLHSGYNNIFSMYRFDPEISAWESAKAMSILRSRVGVAVVDRKLFAFGGYDGSSRLYTVECYDPEVSDVNCALSF